MADISITPASVVPPAANTTLHYAPGTTLTGEAISAGEVVCLLSSDGKFYKADANDTDKQAVVGIAGNTAAVAGQRLDVITESPALEVGAHGQAVGTPLFLSATPGKICPYADLLSAAVPVLVAYAKTATSLQVILAKSLVAKP